LSAIPLRDTSQGTQYICTLKQLLDYLATEYQKGRQTDLLIELEIKISDPHSKRALQELYKLLAEYNPLFDGRIFNHFYVSTFFKNVLDDLQDRPKELKVGLGLIWMPEYSALLATVAVVLASLMVRKYRIDVIEPCLTLASKSWYIQRWRKRGMLLNVHTVITYEHKTYISDIDVACTTGINWIY